MYLADDLVDGPQPPLLGVAGTLDVLLEEHGGRGRGVLLETDVPLFPKGWGRPILCGD